jgi:hypothetical protein
MSDGRTESSIITLAQIQMYCAKKITAFGDLHTNVRYKVQNIYFFSFVKDLEQL